MATDVENKGYDIEDKGVAGEREYINDIKIELQNITDIDKAKKILNYVTVLASLT